MRTHRLSTPALNGTVESAITNAVGRLGEKLVLRRAASLHVPNGLVGAYVHGAAPAAPTGSDGPAVGRIAVLVGADADPAEAPLLRQIAQHVAGFRPTALEGAPQSGALLEQPFLFNDALTVRAALAAAATAGARPPRLLAFERYEVGEGIERQAVDFAAEVNAQLQRP